MSTYLQMQQKIADDLNRADLSTQIQREINRAIRKYASMPMWFSGKSFNFTTALNQWYYDSADGVPSDIRIIDYIRIDQSSPTVNTDTGTANTYVIATTPTTTALADGDEFTFKAGNANTGASTLTVDATATTDITRPNGVALQVGDILANQIVSVVYDSDSSDFFLREKSGTYYELYEKAIDTVVRRNVNDNPGLPLDYAWLDGKIYFYPIPDNTYIVQIFYEKYYTDLSANGDSNDFTTNPEAEQLIEEEAKFQIYSSIILDDERAAKCAQMRDDALKLCKRVTTNFIGQHGAIRPTTF